MRDNERDALVALAEVLPPKPLPNMDYSYEVSPAHARELHSRFDRLMEALAAPAEGGKGEALARRFHETYERLAPSFGYETRKETRSFDPESANGKLMIAVCRELIDSAGGAKCTGADCKPRDGGTLCQSCGGDITPQPAEGNGAVDDTVNILGNVAFEDDWFAQFMVEGVMFLAPLDNKEQARHILAAKKRRPAATAQVPDGFVLVPKEPTEAMRRRGADRWIEANESAMTRKDEEESARCAWSAMLAAAPAAPKGGVVDEAMISAGADALVLGWNLHYPDATRMSKEVLTAALATGEQP